MKESDKAKLPVEKRSIKENSLFQSNIGHPTLICYSLDAGKFPAKRGY